MRQDKISKFTKFYLGAILILAVITAIMAVPAVLLIIVYITGRIGLILLLAPPLLSYAVCFAPAVFIAGPPRFVALVVGALSAIALATVPNHSGQMEMQHEIDEAKAQTFMLPHTQVRSLEIQVARGTSWRGLQSIGCPDCSILLKTGQLDWIRIKDSYGKETAVTQLKAQHGVECASAGVLVDAKSICVAAVQDDGAKPEMTMIFSNDSISENLAINKSLNFATFRSRRVVVATQQDKIVYKRTALSYKIPMFPTVWTAAIGGQFGFEGGLALYPQFVELNATDTDGVFGELGFNLAINPDANASSPPSDLKLDLNLSLQNILNSAQTTAFDAGQIQVISAWVNQTRYELPQKPELLSQVARVIADPRQKDFLQTKYIFEQSPQTSTYLLPYVLDRIENDRDGSAAPAYVDIAIEAVPRMQPEALYPYADRIEKLLRDPNSQGKYLLPAVGRIGIDPSPYLQQMNTEDKIRHQLLVVLAACYAEAKRTPEITPILKAALRAAQQDPNATRRYIMALREVLIEVTDDVSSSIEGMSDRDKGEVDRLNWLAKKRHERGSPDCSRVGFF